MTATIASPLDAAHWRRLATGAPFIERAYIDGAVLEHDGDPSIVVDPSVGRVVAALPTAGPDVVDAAVRSARAAFVSGCWARLAPRRRGQVLLAMAEEIRARRDELAALLVREVGKPIADALGEVASAAEAFAFYGEAVDKRSGTIAPTEPGRLALVSQEPVGVVGAVTPWNYPLLMSTWKVAPALAVGNSVILKPAEQAPLTAMLLGPIATAAGLPDGVLNVVPGRGEVTGAALGRHPDVDAITFTGSTSVGKRFLGYAAESNMKAVWLETGGKSPLVVLDDGGDLDRVARVVAEGIYANAGENCNASSRLLVAESLHDALLAAIVKVAREWRPADPFAPDTRMGALVDQEHFDRVMEYVQIGRQAGADLVTGGRRLLEESGGWYVEPTVFAGVRPADRIAREEIFGPVLTVFPFADEDEAVALANDTDYGLAAGVWSGDLARAQRVAARLRAGAIYVNCFNAGEISVPFGGVKESGLGVDKSLLAMDKYCHVKSTWVDLG